jgi:DNA-directed RNA polymerase subunit beta
MAIEREEIERLAKDRDDELAILDRNVYGRLADMLILGKTASPGPKGFKKGSEITEELLETNIRVAVVAVCRRATSRTQGEGRSLHEQYDDSKKRSKAASWTRSRRCSAATNCRRA